MGFIRNFYYVFHLKASAFRNGIVNLGIKDIPRVIVFSLITLLFILFDYLFFLKVVNYIFNLNEGIGNVIIVELFRIIFVSFFTMVLFSSLILSVSNLYISSDLPYLASLPVKSISIASVKTIQSIFQAAWMPVIFTIPVFVAMGRVYGLEPMFYVFSMIFLVSLLAIAGGLGCALTQLLVRLLKPERVYQAACIAGAIIIVLMLLFLRAIEPERLVGNVPDEMAASFLEEIKVPDYSFLPTTWGALIIKEMMDGSFSPATNFIFLSLAAGIISIAFSLILSLFFYEDSLYLSLDGIKRMKKKTGTSSERYIYKGERLKNFIVMWEKDTKVFLRDPSQWTQMLLLGALMVIYLFNIYKLPLNNYYLKNLVAFINMGMAGFVLSALCTRFVYPSISMEGDSLWMIRSMPVASGKYILSKYIFYLVPLLLFTEALTFASNRLLSVSSFMMVLSLVTIAVITATMVALSVGFGAVYPVFKFENIVQVSASYGGIIFMIVSLSYVGIVITIEAFPVYAYFQREMFLREVGGVGIYVAYGSAFLISLIIAVLSLLKAVRAFSAQEV